MVLYFFPLLNKAVINHPFALLHILFSPHPPPGLAINVSLKCSKSSPEEIH